MEAIAGKVSWFGGPNDSSDSGHTASGGTTKEPGIAVYNRSTLGGYWRVTAPNGKTAVLRQTDLGPAPWTGRKVDVTYSALGKLGYNEGNFPTDSTVHATYLGKNAPAEPNVRTAAIQGLSKGTGEGVGYQAAVQSARGLRAAASLFTSGGAGDELLRETLNKVGQQRIAQASNGNTVAFPANTGQSSSLANAVPHGTKLAGFLAGNEPLTIKRKDQGQDIQTKAGAAIHAPGDGYVKMVQSDPNGFGTAYPVVHFDTGPLAGHDVYIGHTRAALQAGAKFRAGDVLSHTGNGTGPYVGNATGLPGWAEIGLWEGGPIRGAETGGQKIAPLLGT